MKVRKEKKCIKSEKGKSIIQKVREEGFKMLEGEKGGMRKRRESKKDTIND